MVGTGSSSKRKSSKKKRDKVSSKKKKSSTKESKKRQRVYNSVSSYSDDDSLNSEHTLPSTSTLNHRRRNNKNKKLPHHHSVSSYSDDQSVSSKSDSLSTSDSGYKRSKARRSRVSLKATKKRARKRYASPSSDLGAHNVRKRKRLGRDGVAKPRKKSSKKKPRKHLSSSSSSDTESLRRDSVAKPRKKSLKKKPRKHLSSSSSSDTQSCSTCSTADGKRKRNQVTLDKELYKAKKKHKVRSPSCSSFDRGGNHSVSFGLEDVIFSPVNNSSRRLRSVIAVVDQSHDGGEDRWEGDPHKEEIVYDQDDYPSPKSLDSNEGGSKMELDDHSHGAPNERVSVDYVAGEELTGQQLNEARMNNAEKSVEIDMSAPVAVLGGDDLESILRQKALENLRRFKGGLQTGPRSANLKTNSETDVKGSSAGMVDDVENKLTNQGSSNDQEMNQRRETSSKSEFSQLTVVKKLQESGNIEKEPAVAKQIGGHTPDGAAVLGCPEEDRSTGSAVLAKPASRSDPTPGAGAITAEPASSVGPKSEERSLEQQNEAKDGSQFEQKTMSVMRGGEMVQVSYKVYIPKKAPALARRQLKR